MPTFSAITFDRFLEPGPSKSGSDAKPTISKLERRNSSPNERESKPKVIPSSLNTTPETTPLPDSPFSVPHSPYVFHKRRGLNLQKSLSQSNVSANVEMEKGEKKVDDNGRSYSEVVSGYHQDVCLMKKIPEIGEEVVIKNGFNSGGEVEINDLNDGLDENRANYSSMSVGIDLERESVCEDFFDPNDSLSIASYTDGEDNFGGDRSFKMTTPIREFFDASCEELSNGGSHQYTHDFETEIRNIRLDWLTEVEKRKEAEDALNSMERQWDRLKEHLSVVGVTLPAASAIVAEDANLNYDPAEDVCRQISVARDAAISLGRDAAKAEAELEMESWMDSKNFEIARLSDRLRYYETVNHEMFQRNQETVEMARHQREKRRIRQRWIWSSIGLTIALGSAALAWSYSSTSKGLLPTDSFRNFDTSDNAEL